MQEIVEKRQIKQLLHFTQAANLSSILHHGLLGRSVLQSRGIEYRYNDGLRLDGHMSGICLSISFPNYRMFYKKRCETINANWIIFAVSPSILSASDTLFFQSNAAAARSAGIFRHNSTGRGALERMFADEVSGQRRADLQLPDHFTTDPQAEVMHCRPIPIEAILGIAVQTPAEASTIQSAAPRLKVKCFANWFYPRSDYKFWQ